MQSNQLKVGTNLQSNGLWDRIKKDFRRNKVLYLMILLPIAYFIIFHYVPMYGVIISFKDFTIRKGIMGSPWVGFKHFKNFFNNVYFWRLLRNTFNISLWTLIFGFPAGLILALLINELSNKKFVKTVQTLTYIPHFISLVVICGMIVSFTGTRGFITHYIERFTGDNTSLLMKKEAFVPLYVISNIWAGAGWGSIIYLSALTNIDQQLYEACEIDGGGRLRQTWHVTLPGILPTIVILFIMRMGQVLNVGYEKIILLYNDLTRETADVISTYVYRQGLESNNYSYASAVGLFNSVVNIIFLVTFNAISKKVTETSLW